MLLFLHGWLLKTQLTVYLICTQIINPCAFILGLWWPTKINQAIRTAGVPGIFRPREMDTFERPLTIAHLQKVKDNELTWGLNNHSGQNSGYKSVHLLNKSAFLHFYLACLVQFAIREKKQQRYVTSYW